MRYLFTSLTLIVVLGSICSCKKNPNNGVPFYMAMDWGHVNSNANTNAGDTTHFVSDVWVQTSSTNLGAYQLSCNFPVLQENKVSFIVNAGVWESGQQEVRVPYPFYAPDTFTVNAIPGQTYFHHPIFSYLPANTITTSCVENFENGIVYDSMTQVSLLSDTNVKYGHYCGVITLTATNSDVVSTVTNPSVNMGTAFNVNEGAEVWMELDYKAQVPFWIGIIGTYPAGEKTASEVLFTLPTATWTKLYVKLTNVVAGTGAAYYYPYFEAIDTVGGSGGNVYLDNIKVLHF